MAWSEDELAGLPVPMAVVDGGGVVRASSAGGLGIHAGSDFSDAVEGGGRALADLRASPEAAVEARLRDGSAVLLRAAGDGEGGLLIAVLDDRRAEAAREELRRLQADLAEAERQRTRSEVLRRAISDEAGAPELVGSSAPMLSLREQVSRVAPSDATVLIHGETGTGKELVARAVHAASRRASSPLVSVNCAALPETLLESELFGHERGAFTGADRQKAGKFEAADSGTMFLDEIAELSAQAQAKLLRVLQEGTFERVGGTETVRVDVRLVAATHRDLAQEVRRGRFREDLFFRLNVVRIDVPALRERRDDIAPLVAFFHERHARRMARPVLAVSERSMRRLLAYRWPGNVRELENAVERATLLGSGPELEIDITPAPGATGPGGGAGGGEVGERASAPRDVLLDLTLDQLQRLQIMHALETCGYRVFGASGAGTKLGINPQTLLSRMDRLGIPRPRAMRRARGGGGGAG